MRGIHQGHFLSFDHYQSNCMGNQHLVKDLDSSLPWGELPPVSCSTWTSSASCSPPSRLLKWMQPASWRHLCFCSSSLCWEKALVEISSEMGWSLAICQLLPLGVSLGEQQETPFSLPTSPLIRVGGMGWARCSLVPWSDWSSPDFKEGRMQEAYSIT